MAVTKFKEPPSPEPAPAQDFIEKATTTAEPKRKRAPKRSSAPASSKGGDGKVQVTFLTRKALQDHPLMAGPQEVVSFRLPFAATQKLKAICHAYRVPLADVLRQATINIIDIYDERYEQATGEKLPELPEAPDVDI